MNIVPLPPPPVTRPIIDVLDIYEIVDDVPDPPNAFEFMRDYLRQHADVFVNEKGQLVIVGRAGDEHFYELDSTTHMRMHLDRFSNWGGPAAATCGSRPLAWS